MSPSKPRPRCAPIRTVVERIGRHAVKIDCGHVETLCAGEADAVGRRLSCEECSAPRGEVRDQAEARR